MLAYVFWHRSAADAGAAYEERLRAFQAALREVPPEGFVACWTYRPLARGGDGRDAWGDAYEDWYLVRDWAALGVLNDAAVDAARRAPHDAVAGLAEDGTAGVYALVAGEAQPPRTVRTTFAKPAGMPYAMFLGDVLEPARGGGAVWQRQMTLGPGPEFRIYGDAEAAPLGVLATHARLRLV